MNPRQVLKQLLKRNKLLVAPGCFDGLSARLVEEAGFEAAYLSGGAVARSMGIPDIGLVTMSEVIERAAQVVSAVRIPVIADADTGYGNAVNLVRAVREFERTGAAAIHIEDQITPKRCGHLDGKEVIPLAEMEKNSQPRSRAAPIPTFVLSRALTRAAYLALTTQSREAEPSTNWVLMLSLWKPHSQKRNWKKSLGPYPMSRSWSTSSKAERPPCCRWIDCNKWDTGSRFTHLKPSEPASTP